MEKTDENSPHEVHIYNDPNEDLEDDLLPEYDFSSMKARPNSYAARVLKQQAEANKAEKPHSSEG